MIAHENKHITVLRIRKEFIRGQRFWHYKVKSWWDHTDIETMAEKRNNTTWWLERTIHTNQNSSSWLELWKYLVQWTEIHTLKFITEISSVMVQCDGLWEVIRSWGESPNEWDQCFIKQTQRSSRLLSTTCAPSKKTVIYEQRSGFSPDTKTAGTLILDFSASRTGRNKFLLFKGPPTQWFCYRSPNEHTVRAWFYSVREKFSCSYSSGAPDFAFWEKLPYLLSCRPRLKLALESRPLWRLYKFHSLLSDDASLGAGGCFIDWKTTGTFRPGLWFSWEYNSIKI